MVYEWLKSHWELLTSQYHTETLAHAYLLNGVPGIGKIEFAKCFAKFSLCDNISSGDVAACGRCKQCKLVEAGTHPDLKIIEPEESSSVVKVDAIRSMVVFFEQSSMQAGRKIAILAPAEGLNVNAANALLKTLEEPNGDSLIILVSHNAGQLLPTIRSRCQVLDMSLPSLSQSLSWLSAELQAITDTDLEQALRLANMAPLRAKVYLETDAYLEYCAMLDELALCIKKQALLPKVAERWGDDIAIVRMQWVVSWVEILVKVKFSALDVQEYYQSKMFSHLASVNDSAVLMDLYHYLLKQLRLLQGTSNPNKALLFEEVLVKLSRLL